MPFQVALQNCDPWGLMTSYNKVNGIHVSENPELLRKVLYEEWGYRGMLMSDWYALLVILCWWLPLLIAHRFGTYSTSEAVKYGLDLEMPGPSTWRGFALKQALRANKVSMSDVEARVRNVLKLVKRAIESGIPQFAPDCVGDSKAAGPLLRELATSSIVLLKNQGSVLPFKKDLTVRQPRLHHSLDILNGSNPVITRSLSLDPTQKWPESTAAVRQPFIQPMLSHHTRPSTREPWVT